MAGIAQFFIDLKNKVIAGLSLLVAILVGILYFLWRKKEADDALLQNQQTKEQINTLNETISKNDGLLEAEEQKRKDLEDQLKQKERQDASKDALLDFLNSKK